MTFVNPFQRLLRVLVLAAASLGASAAPHATIAFSPASIPASATSTLVIGINDDVNAAFSGGVLNLTYNPNVVNKASAVAFNGCPGSTVTANAGASSLSVNLDVPAFQFCQIYVNVTSSVSGSWTTTLNPGNFTSTTPTGSNSSASSSTLTVVAPTMVTNTNDKGAGSLAAAIGTVNGSCPSGSTIHFNIPGAGPHTINLFSQLPAVTCPGLVIDGTTQSGSVANADPGIGNTAQIQVDLNGIGCSACTGLQLLASGIEVRGLAIRSFNGHGIVSKAGSGTNYIFGNFIGTDPGGMTGYGNNGAGVEVDSGYAVIGGSSPGDRNLVTSNGSGGIVAAGGAASISNNQVGGRRDGSSGLGNGVRGIYLNGANYSSNNVTDNYVHDNGGAGIAVTSSTFTRVVMTNNASYNNSGIGIDVGDDGATVNNEAGPPYDGDSVQNYPVITSVIHTGGNTVVDGYLKSVANRPASIYLYHNSAMNALTEGERAIDGFSPSLDATGYLTFTRTIGGTWDNVTAQVTIDTCGDGCMRSSEYSPKVAAAAPVVSLTPGSLAFASRTISTTSPAQTVTLANTGNAPLAIASVAISGDFAFTSGCGVSLAAGGSCTIDVTFTPLVAGARSGSLTLTDNASGSPRAVPLSGTGVSGAAAVLNVSHSVVDFPAQPVGSDSAPDIVTVSNAGTAPLTFSAISITGEFALGTPAGTSPPACPVTLAPGASCRIVVIFRPMATNLRQGVLTIATNGGTVTVTVMGTGLVAEPPQLVVPASLDFGSQPVGIPSVGRSPAMRNTSPYVASITELTATGDFSVSDACTTIAVGATCSPLITFTPTLLGPRTGTLTVRTLRDANPYRVALTGTGAENRLPALELSPVRLGYGNAFVGQLVTHEVTLRNVGLAPLTVSSIIVTGDFFSDGGCVGPLAPTAACTVRITFAASVPGGRNGVMRIASDAPGSPHDVSLSGTGCFLPTPSRARFGVLLCGS